MKQEFLLRTAAFFFTFSSLLPAGAAPSDERPKWDQAKAEAKVKALIEQENRDNFAWDKIRWLTDAKAAVKLAQKERKPLLVYLFLKRNVGPAAAPC